MSTLTPSSRLNLTARAISYARSSATAPFSSGAKSSSQRRDSVLEELNNISATPHFSATPRFRVLMAMEPVDISTEEENVRGFLGNRLPDFELRGGMASLNHRWEKFGFAINFIAIVTAIAYVMLT